MKLTTEEVARRLAEADRIRSVLRKATIEWRELGDRILRESGQRDGPQRSDDPGPRGR